MEATGFVTAGGRSSRMGRDKAWLELGGITIIERIIAALKPATRDVFVIANDPAYNRLGLPVLSDTNSGIGPVEAIRTALSESPTDRMILVGCDLPFVTTALFELLLENLGKKQVAVPVGQDGMLEPLCAAYNKSALGTVTSLIESGERKISRFYERLETKLVTYDELKHLPGSELFFFNLNSPDDYELAKNMLI